MKNSKLSIVFWVSLALAGVFILWGVFLPDNVETVLGFIDGLIANNFGWVYIIATTLFVLLALFLVFGPYGRIRLGSLTKGQNTATLHGLHFYLLQGWV
ncbi:glycine betaine transporter OpuD [Geomicrobium sp. JCM 19055]|nr:glycine betaine transporter OpuD [Geomicrobium sp. JCM 19055]